jgi:hypothetical protein
MKITTKEKITNFLNSIKVENLEIMDYIDIDNIDMDSPFDSINDMIEDNGGFNIEIIYYFNAMEYLSKNDPSLTISINIASEYMEDFRSLNSEILASLLASQIVRQDFYNERDNIETFFNYLNK